MGIYCFDEKHFEAHGAHVMRSLLEKLTAHVAPPRVIQDGLGREKYLSRWYVFGRGKPKMKDGTSPWDRWGNPKPDAVWPTVNWSLYLHKFHRGDVDRELHNHPWQWSISLILAGGYVEERRHGNSVTKRRMLPWSINTILAEDYHRVDLIEKDAWTLFLVGPKISGWGFWDRETGGFTPWREFLAGKQKEIS